MDDRKEVLLDYIVSYSNQLLATDERQRGAVKKGKLPSTELDDERQAKLDRKLRELGDRWEHIHENGEHVMKNNLTSIHGHSASLESCLNELTGRESKPLNVDIGPQNYLAPLSLETRALFGTPSLAPMHCERLVSKPGHRIQVGERSYLKNLA